MSNISKFFGTNKQGGGHGRREKEKERRKIRGCVCMYRTNKMFGWQETEALVSEVDKMRLLQFQTKETVARMDLNDIHISHFTFHPIKSQSFPCRLHSNLQSK